MRHRPDPDMLTLYDATRWLASAWTTLPTAPTRIHVRDIEDGSQLGAHRFSLAMWRVLTSTPEAYETVTETDTCFHPGLRRIDRPQDCRLCRGDGVRQFERARYRSPMAAALMRLSRLPTPLGRPTPVDVIVAYVWSQYRPHVTARWLGMPIVTADHARTIDAMLLLNARRLRGEYSSGPIPRLSWLDKSTSQQAAESVPDGR